MDQVQGLSESAVYLLHNGREILRWRHTVEYAVLIVVLVITLVVLVRTGGSRTSNSKSKGSANGRKALHTPKKN